MEGGKTKKSKTVKKTETQGYLSCDGCVRRVKAESCTWDDGDDGDMFCPDCRAERESCGCSA